MYRNSLTDNCVYKVYLTINNEYYIVLITLQCSSNRYCTSYCYVEWNLRAFIQRLQSL
jgi:cellobiose phosphorylase